MNRQRTLLLALLLCLFFGVSALIISSEIWTRNNTFVAGAPTQDIKDVILPNETPVAQLRPPALLPTDFLRFGGVSSTASVIEFGDYACTTCKAMAPILKRVIASYNGNVRFVWRDFPVVTQHQTALEAAVFARCAGLEGKYWEAHDELIATDSLDAFAFNSIAKKLNLTSRTFEYCLGDAAMAAAISREVDVARGDGISNAPTIFIGTKAFVGPISEQELRAEIDRFLRS